MGDEGNLPPAVDLRCIDKSFYGVKANDGVDFELKAGEVHALLGENGAGKSTLCSVLAGLYRPEAGEVLLDGRPVHFRTPKDALAAGVGMVYQHFRLVENLTVAENLVLGHPDLPVWVQRRRWEDVAAETGERFGLPVDPSARIWQLSVGEQQRVEILKLLFREARVLILDEPTAVLTPQESNQLFATMRRLAGEGRSVIFVSHKLAEVKEVSDRVTVLRDGRNAGQGETAHLSPNDLASMMVGRELRLPRRETVVEPGEAALAVSGLRVTGDRGLETVRGVSLQVREGEILGLAGVAGNGQQDLAYGIAGLRAPSAGRVEVAGRDVTGRSVRARIAAGLAYIPQNRLGVGLAPGLTTEENLALKSYRRPPYSRRGVLAAGAFRAEGSRRIEDYDIRGVRPGLPIRLLSGGNLQKALVAREIELEPKVILAVSPTRGLDVGATEAVRELLLAQRRRGAAVLLISEDLDELLALSDRIAVIYEGEIVGELEPEEATADQLGLLMAGHLAEPHPPQRVLEQGSSEGRQRELPSRGETGSERSA